MQILASPVKGIQAKCVYQSKGIYLYMHAQKPYLCKTIKEEEKVEKKRRLPSHSTASLTGQLRAGANLWPELEEDEWEERQQGSDKSQEQSGVLATHVVEELRCEQRRHGTEGVTHETLTGDGRRGVLAVAVGGETVARFEDEEDSDGDEGKADDGSNPDETLVLRERVDEETDGEPDCTEEGTVETGFGEDAAVVGGADGVVLLDLEEVQTETESNTDAERDVGQARDTLVPAALLLEGDGDDGQEEEGQEPGEGDPETEEKDNRLGEEHANGLDGRVVQHLLDTGGFELRTGDETLVTGSFAEGLGALVEVHTATGLTEEEDDDDHQRDVGQTLDTLDPAPADGLVDEAGVDGGSDGTQNGDVGERGHGDGPVLRRVHITESTTDENGTDTTEKTEQGTADDDGGNVLAQRETDEHESEADVSTDVDDLPTRQLTEGGQEHGSAGTGEVESEQTQLSKFLRDTKFRTHTRDTRAVRRCGKTNEESHETQQQTEETLLLATPVEGVVEVPGAEIEDDDLVVVVDGGLSEGQREIDVDLLQRASIRERRLVVMNLLGIFPSDNTTELNFFLLRGGMCRGILGMGWQLRLLGLFLRVHLEVAGNEDMLTMEEDWGKENEEKEEKRWSLKQKTPGDGSPKYSSTLLRTKSGFPMASRTRTESLEIRAP